VVARNGFVKQCLFIVYGFICSSLYLSELYSQSLSDRISNSAGKIDVFQQDRFVGRGTYFLIRYRERNYLVTARHVADSGDMLYYYYPTRNSEYDNYGELRALQDGEKTYYTSASTQIDLAIFPVAVEDDNVLSVIDIEDGCSAASIALIACVSIGGKTMVFRGGYPCEDPKFYCQIDGVSAGSSGSPIFAYDNCNGGEMKLIGVLAGSRGKSIEATPARHIVYIVDAVYGGSRENGW
jgi:hypothetical protein